MALRRALATLLILGSVIAIDAGTPVQADTSEPPYISSFTGKGLHVNGEIAKLIKQAGKGDKVKIALFIGEDYDPKGKQTRPAVWTAIKTALDNGAKVEIVTEGRLTDDKRNKPGDPGKSKEQAEATRKFFGDLEDAGAKVTYCNDGCIRSNRPKSDTDRNRFAINHHKFFLLDFAKPSKHRGWKRIVVQSSANVRERGDGLFEQAIAFDGRFYDNVWKQYSDRFEALKTNARDGDDDLALSRPTPWRSVSAFIGPYSDAQQRQKQPPDEYLTALKRIKTGKNCRVSIVMGHWTKDPRSTKIVERLNRLVDMGCSVDAIGGNKREMQAWGHTAKFELEYTPKVHAKFMLLHYYDASRERRGKDPWRTLTYAGSHNFTQGSWAYDDDAFVRVTHPAIYDDFCKYFDKIEREKVNPNNPPIHWGRQAKGRCVDFS